MLRCSLCSLSRRVTWKWLVESKPVLFGFIVTAVKRSCISCTSHHMAASRLKVQGCYRWALTQKPFTAVYSIVNVRLLIDVCVWRWTLLPVWSVEVCWVQAWFRKRSCSSLIQSWLCPGSSHRNSRTTSVWLLQVMNWLVLDGVNQQHHLWITDHNYKIKISNILWFQHLRSEDLLPNNLKMCLYSIVSS